MITTHVLDTAARQARAAASRSSSSASSTATWHLVGGGVTDDDGRLRTLTPAGPGRAGHVSHPVPDRRVLRRAEHAGFFPVVEIQFTVVDGAQHYHVPLLLSPYGFSTYRGS